MNLVLKNFKNYELIDIGNGEKLERFGNVITIRPEPQALWNKRLSDKEWEKQAHVKFISKSSSSGYWKKFKPTPDNWTMTYRHNGLDLTFKLALTAFKHVGIFPEQAVNWDFIFDKTQKISQPKVLNLFAYTGGASLAAKAAGADITHVDSVKQVISWANNNMALSGLSDIRWIVEDAMKFAKRAERKGTKYHGIILDPPAYGHGAKGEHWKLEKHLNELVKTVLNILHPEQYFLVLNTYSLNLSPYILDNLIAQYGKYKNMESGELIIPSKTNFKLPLGSFVRFSNV